MSGDGLTDKIIEHAGAVSSVFWQIILNNLPDFCQCVFRFFRPLDFGLRRRVRRWDVWNFPTLIFALLRVREPSPPIADGLMIRAAMPRQFAVAHVRGVRMCERVLDDALDVGVCAPQAVRFVRRKCQPVGVGARAGLHSDAQRHARRFRGLAAMIAVVDIDRAGCVLDALRHVKFHAVAHHLRVFVNEREIHLRAGLNVVRCGRVNLPNVRRDGLLLRRLRGLNRLGWRVRLGVAR